MLLQAGHRVACVAALLAIALIALWVKVGANLLLLPALLEVLLATVAGALASAARRLSRTDDDRRREAMGIMVFAGVCVVVGLVCIVAFIIVMLRHR